MEFKGTKEDWELVFTSDRKRAIRSKSGLICVLPSPSKYPGQDKRYDDELEEVKANQKLIASAPEMLEMLNLLIDRLEENNLGSLNAVSRAKKLISKITE